MNLKAPDLIMQGNTSFCPGCGHGIIGRLLFENIVEMGYEENSVTVVDVACCSLLMYSTNADFVGAAHGRVLPTASGVKRARKSNLVTAYHGDGAAYSIGMSHTVWSAIRNENITVIVVNNQVFGMTGGQMAPTTLEGQKTTSSPSGRDIKRSGPPFDITEALKPYKIAYLARGSVDTPSDIRKTKAYIAKGIKNQMDNKGFSLIEILSPCPTNWNVTPIDAIHHMKNVVKGVYPLGEFIKGGEKV